MKPVVGSVLQVAFCSNMKGIITAQLNCDGNGSLNEVGGKREVTNNGKWEGWC